MAFDAAFTAAITKELCSTVGGARIEKIFQPSKESFLFIVRPEKREGVSGSLKLLIDAGSSSPRIGLVTESYENPKVPPMLCMLLRKHLSGARITEIKQIGFDRVIEITLECRDELGFISKKYLYVEIMGKFSNLVFCDRDKKVISAVKTSDISSQNKHPMIPGVPYCPPPQQEGKISPLAETEEGFERALDQNDKSISKFIMNRYCGFSPLLAREMEYLTEAQGCRLSEIFFSLVDKIKSGDFQPMLLKRTDSTPFDYYFMKIGQYGDEISCVSADSFSSLLEDFYAERARTERIKQKASDILRLLTNAESRLTKKIALQTADLESCKEKEQFKRYGDLITANIYLLSRGMTSAVLTEWTEDGENKVEVPLDGRLTPSQNAQRYYKKYNKCKSAEVNLKIQIELARAELEYINTVFDSLTKAETEDDMSEIRRELYESGYASRMKNYKSLKLPAPKPMKFITSGGYTVLCGKNNSQNDYLTHKLASKTDIWFHIKGYAGSHVIMQCGTEDPPAEDFTEAATIAAVYSKAPRGQRVEVDYTRVKNVKKPPNSKPGFVTFSSNYSAYVMADPALISALRVDK